MTVPPIVVHITGDASGVVAASKQASVAVGGMREHVGRELEELSVVTERTANKLEHVGVQSAFLFSSIADGGEKGLTRLGHSIAALGFMFNPLWGAVALGAAIGLEKLVEHFHKAEEEIKKFREAFAAELGKMANAGESSKLQEKMKEVFYGTPFDEKGTLVKASKYAIGAFEGSLADLEAHFDKLHTQIPRGATFAAGKVAEEYNKVVAQLDVMRDRAAQVRAAITNLASQEAPGGMSATIITADSDKKRADELEKDRKFLSDYVDAVQAALRKRLDAEQELVVKLAKLREEWRWESIKAQASVQEAIRSSLDQIAKKNKQVSDQMAKDGAETVKKIEAQWHQFLDVFPAAWDGAVQRWRTSIESVGAFWRDFMRNIVLEAARAEAKMLISHAAHWAAKKGITLSGFAAEALASTWATIKVVANYAYQAAAAAWAAIAGIPIVGPFLAPAVAAATLAGVLALASGGGGGGGPSPSAHASAAPASSASASRSGGDTYIIQAMDAQSFHRFAMDNAPTFTKATMQGASAGVRIPTSPGRGS